MKSLLLSGAVLAATIVLAPAVVHADLPPPAAEACATKSAGATCTLNGGAGICTDQTCTRADMANWDHDASATPPTISYACVLCVTGATNDAATDDAATNDAATDDAATNDAATNGGATNDAATDTPAGGDDGSCALGGRTVRRGGPWLLAVAFSSLLLLGRRSRRRR